MGLMQLRSQFPHRTVASNAVIGEFSYGAPVIRHWGEDSTLTIGKFCSIAERVTILLGGEHRTDWATTYPFNSLLPEYAPLQGHPKSKGDIVIGNDVWIGTGATILSGVRIGDGVVIGAEALVSKSVPPYTIAAGNPAKALRRRFADADIARLIEMKWWDWPLASIEAAIPLLQSSDVQGLFRFYERLVASRG
ncbi:CatB-related O-acetyltransferase [Cohnella lubricantis]|nr:acetyltransferase-like isoleucine patch superfamily enzyme [Cohnella lubricantis]